MTSLTFPNQSIQSPGFGYVPSPVSASGRTTDLYSSAMSLSGMYGPVTDDEGLRVLKEAYDLGATFWDTAAVYGLGHNESLIGRFVSENPGARERLFIASKCAFEVCWLSRTIRFHLRYLSINDDRPMDPPMDPYVPVPWTSDRTC